ncbi:MAG: helix-turn-helix domain-containing protein [Conexivisphaerales archaeon]
MRPACEYSIRYLLPAFRSTVAKKLVFEYGMTQQEVAALLGTTQAAVSHYLSSRRAKLVKVCENSSIVKRYAMQVASKLASKEMNVDEANEFFCRMCIKLQDEGSFWAILGLEKRGTFIR